MTTWMHEQRLEAVCAVLHDLEAARVLDLGCGDGDLFIRLVSDARIERLVGIDINMASLERLRRRLDTLPLLAGKVDVRLGSMIEPDPRLTGFDCALMVETIEHVDPGNLSRLERAVFEGMRPRAVVVTTPNAEFNPLLGVPPHRFRHPDHRFEWTRARFSAWGRRVGLAAGYDVKFHDIAGQHPDLGGASQMAVFRLAGV